MSDRQPSAPVSASSTSLSESVQAHDHNLLDRARQDWLAGEWEKIVQIEIDALGRHPDRAKLALIVASAWQHLNDHSSARRFTKLAIEWGCDRQLMARVLIANVHNTLARSAALVDDPAKTLLHFRAAVAGTRGNAAFSSSLRAQKELDRVGLAIAGDSARLALVKKSPSDELAAKPKEQKALGSPEALKFYEGFSIARGAAAPPRFVLLESKSLPRSGLHYLKATLSRILGEHFSFCEWYQEPGCCRRMPCALTGYATEAEKQDRVHVRLTKSHDFELKDPVHALNRSLRRVVLVRDPLYVLTSYFALDQLAQYERQLRESGIAMAKIWLSHESAVVDMAYDVLDRHYVFPSDDALTKWLRDKGDYCVKFLKKWLTVPAGGADEFASVVPYHCISKYVKALMKELAPVATHEITERAEEFGSRTEAHFHPRSDPFQVRSRQLSSYMSANAFRFEESAREILARAPTEFASALAQRDGQ